VSAKNPTTHTIIQGVLTIALRDRSSIWQCRYKIDGKWQRNSTHERDFKAAKDKALEIYNEATWRKKNNIAPITRFFKDIAKVVVKKLQDEITNGYGKPIYKDYITAINKYLIPILGKYKIDSIDYKVLSHFEQERLKYMKKEPTKSTQLTHNAALNRIFDEAIFRGYMVAANKPILKAKGKKTERRVEFSVEEVKALRGNFEAWIERGRADTRHLRALLRDYVEILLDTGARPGKELLDLTWGQVELEVFPVFTPTGLAEQPNEYEPEAGELINFNLNQTVYLNILTGKTARVKGGRKALGYLNTYKALSRIADRNYNKSVKQVIKEHENDYIFRFKEFQSKKNNKLNTEVKLVPPTSLVKLFNQYLNEHNLLTDPSTKKDRQLYSLRHTYATIRLLYDKVSPAIIVKQMGTSLSMLEKHYDHIETIKSVHQLRNDESRKLIEADIQVDSKYAYDESKAKKKPTSN